MNIFEKRAENIVEENGKTIIDDSHLKGNPDFKEIERIAASLTEEQRVKITKGGMKNFEKNIAKLRQKKLFFN